MLNSLSGELVSLLIPVGVAIGLCYCVAILGYVVIVSQFLMLLWQEHQKWEIWKLIVITGVGAGFFLLYCLPPALLLF